VSGDTARKLALFFVAGATILTFATEKSAERRYRKLWGITMLGAGAAALSDFAPAVVGPFIALVLVAYAAGHQGQIGGVVSQIKQQATQ